MPLTSLANDLNAKNINGGEVRTRTEYLLNANQPLCQMSYNPLKCLAENVGVEPTSRLRSHGLANRPIGPLWQFS
jgi:hypothetical protein